MTIKSREDAISYLNLLGITVDDSNKCFYSRNKKTFVNPLNETYGVFASKNRYNIAIFFESLENIFCLLKNHKNSNISSNEYTKRIFIHSLKRLNVMSNMFNFKNDNIINITLKKDINCFSESFMSSFIDNFLCLEWIRLQVEKEAVISFLLKNLMQFEVTKSASGSMGHVDLKMEERVWKNDDNPIDMSGENEKLLHPLYVRKFQQYDMQHHKTQYNIFDIVHRNYADPQRYDQNRKDLRQDNRTLSGPISG